MKYIYEHSIFEVSQFVVCCVTKSPAQTCSDLVVAVCRKLACGANKYTKSLYEMFLNVRYIDGFNALSCSSLVL